ncbi:MAG: hypothetical protein IJ787_04245 [Bacilli bacterium]|nr:hypothetical protein [Bacilli bacterium]
MNLLEEKCVVVAEKTELVEACKRYRIFDEAIEAENLGPDASKVCPYIVSEEGVREAGKDCLKGLTVFKSLYVFRLYLFKKALFRGRIVVHKRTYRSYLKAIRLLKKLDIKTIKDRTYFQEAHCFYVSGNRFKELDPFGCKVIVSMTKGIQFNTDELVRALKTLIKDKNKYLSKIVDP